MTFGGFESRGDSSDGLHSIHSAVFRVTPRIPWLSCSRSWMWAQTSSLIYSWRDEASSKNCYDTQRLWKRLWSPRC